MSHLFRSLLLAALLSSAAPLLAVGSLLLSFTAASQVPGIADLGERTGTQIVAFLAAFGSGYPLQGMLAISLTCGMVGGLFDLFNFHFYRRSPFEI